MTELASVVARPRTEPVEVVESQPVPILWKRDMRCSLSFDDFLSCTRVFLKEVIMSEIKYEIVQQFGALSISTSGWTKQLNLISWNDREAKFDIRDWSGDGMKMGKGVTLSLDELLALRDLLNSMEL